MDCRANDATTSIKAITSLAAGGVYTTSALYYSATALFVTLMKNSQCCVSNTLNSW